MRHSVTLAGVTTTMLMSGYTGTIVIVLHKYAIIRKRELKLYIEIFRIATIIIKIDIVLHESFNWKCIYWITKMCNI